MSEKFNLADIIAGAGGEMKNAGQVKIEYIALDKIFEDERNFYHIDERSVEELAANIEAVGLQQPILVRADGNGEYTIVSGHRRYSALALLQENDPERWWEVPCIVEQDAVSPAMQELRLIFANSATRKMSDFDIAKQTERVTELLYQLKEEGVEFPGSMRKHVAEACQISETKLATLKVINENLHEHFKAQFEKGELSTDAAYKIARLPELVQMDLVAATPGKISGFAAENILKNYEKYYDQTRLCPGGEQICQNVHGMLRQTALSNYIWCECEEVCCLKCDHGNCKNACSRRKEVDKNTQESAEKNKRQESAKYQELARAKVVAAAKRIVEFADRAGVADEVVINTTYSAFFGEIRKWAHGKIQGIDFDGDELDYVFVDDLVHDAELLGVSTDVLLGLAEPGESSAAPVACQWQTGKPDREGLYVVKIDTGSKRPSIQPIKWSAMNWHYPSSGGILVGGVLGWYKIPEV